MKPAKNHSTKNVIVSTALGQAVTFGLEGISLGGIASAIGMSKSGLFAHFKSKEALQLAVIDEALTCFDTKVLGPALAQPKGLPRLKALFNKYIDWMAGSSGLATCPFTVFIQEYDARPGSIRDQLVQSELQWRNTVSKVADQAIQMGHIHTDASAEQITFEFIGAAFSFQVSHSLLAHETARQQANVFFERLIATQA